MRVIALLNRSAGTLTGNPHSDPLSPAALTAAFRAAAVDADVRLVAPQAMRDEVAHAAALQPDAVVVGGGDGTLNTAAGVLAGGATPLGVLPLGTLNHFAHDLGLPLEIDDAIRVIARGRVRAIDVGEVNGRVFLNNCSLGAYPAAVQRRDSLRRTRGFGKWRAMVVASLDVFRRVRRLRAQIEIDGAPHSCRTPLLFVSNNHYDGRLFASSLREHLDEGRLWLYVARTHRFFPLLRSAWQALVRGLDAADALDTHSAQQVTIDVGLPKITTGLDGELVTFAAPLRFRIRPHALRVLAPPAS
ncbi:hypothetical protein K0B96_12385 [Horticoccus luteus]|uniref:DAGKc domain-containing protein n=1 Tax=Horticoccus luteus TaxID=2862869 RepID=A0A8F9TRY4_9BACT|nr:diacylglycerol kinase family protein [Horticoccus luteus]QYM78104.1 hypothetical protein K0B96_12385 [Horticoccus luteus]